MKIIGKKTFTNCKICKKEFSFYTCMSNKRSYKVGIYCSQDCYKKDITKWRHADCIVCGKEFVIRNSRYRKRKNKNNNYELKYCSHKCYDTKFHEARKIKAEKRKKWEERRDNVKLVNINAGGYLTLRIKKNNRTKYELMHRRIMEQHIKRTLTSDEHVHHINGVRHDNRIENLELWSKSHPSGQRVIDKITWAKEILTKYSPVIDKL